MSNATNSILERDAEYIKTSQLAQQLFHIIRDYVPYANKNEVSEIIFKFLSEGNVAIISKPQLRVYQELEKLAIAGSMMTTNKGLFTNG